MTTLDTQDRNMTKQPGVGYSYMMGGAASFIAVCFALTSPSRWIVVALIVVAAYFWAIEVQRWAKAAAKRAARDD